MANIFNVRVDLSQVAELGRPLQEAVQGRLKQAAQVLAGQVYAHVLEQANKKLHTRRQMFIDAVTFYKDDLEKVIVIQLDGSARWIDDGMQPHNMIEDLLKSPKAKIAKDGSRYMVIPFGHGGSGGAGATQTTPAQQVLMSTIKQVLSQKKINYAKLERHSDGTPKLGLLHSFSVNNAPAKTGSSLGQGAGPVGDVMQGPTGIPLLQGIRIYQKMGKGKKGEDIVNRAIMTFRVVSSKHSNQPGRWDHPGLPPVGIFDEAAQWASDQWDKVIAPGILEDILGRATNL